MVSCRPVHAVAMMSRSEMNVSGSVHGILSPSPSRIVRILTWIAVSSGEACLGRQSTAGVNHSPWWGQMA